MLGSSSRRLVEAAAVIMSHAGSAMRPQLVQRTQLLSLASNRLLALAKSDSLRSAKASVRQVSCLGGPTSALHAAQSFVGLRELLRERIG